MLNESQLSAFVKKSRTIEEPNAENTQHLGPLAALAGTWEGKLTGWNMIALPFITPKSNKGPSNTHFAQYRLLMNQYNETLKFGPVHYPVPNRGISWSETTQTDQFNAAIEYHQAITQVSAAHSFLSDNLPVIQPVTEGNNTVIHAEPGMWLHITNQTTLGLDLARLGTIPHGNSVLALGTSKTYKGGPQIANLDGTPTGVGQEAIDAGYLAPYHAFRDKPFMGNVTAPTFPGFDPTQANNLLRFDATALDALDHMTPVQTTEITVDTDFEQAGIVNTPFIHTQANATKMKFTFWIQELQDATGNTKWRLSYSQTVILDFFGKSNNWPGRIAWPHISINTLDKVSD